MSVRAKPENEARNAAILDLQKAGVGERAIARRLGLSVNIVAGVLHRDRNPPASRRPARGFRSDEYEAQAKAAAALADRIGLMAASRQLGIDPGQVCRWRQRVRQLEAQA